MRFLLWLDDWISRAWNAGLRSDPPRHETIDPETAHELQRIQAQERRRSKPVAMTGDARRLLREGRTMEELESEITENIGRPRRDS